MTRHILIIEDDAALSQMLSLHFSDHGFTVSNAFHCAEVLPAIEEFRPDLVLLDQQLPDGLGNELIPSILETCPSCRIIMMTGVHDLELAIQAIKDGATDFIHKPVKTELLQLTVDQALAHNRAPEETTAEPPRSPIRELIGRSDAMLKVSKDIALSAETSATVLITGESGTGKEIVARLIHQHSNRKGPFVAINCAAIVDSLLESELFGHEKGAFTGATTRKAGKFELASEGTLFLDEIGELAPQLQAKLLRALQEHVVEPVGGAKSIAINTRVIAATNKDLFSEAAEGNFREDLAYRLNVIHIHLPPLRQRKEDIPLLAKALVEKVANQIGKPALPITQAAMASLTHRDWPGNVRELENILTQALVQARDGAITPDLLSGKSADQPKDEPEPDTGFEGKTLEQVEAEYIQQVLNHTGGHKVRSCEILGISRPALDRKIKKFNLIMPTK